MGITTYGVLELKTDEPENLNKAAPNNCDKVFCDIDRKVGGPSASEAISKLGASCEARYYRGDDAALKLIKKCLKVERKTFIDTSDATKPNEENVAKKASKSVFTFGELMESLRAFVKEQRKKPKLDIEPPHSPESMENIGRLHDARVKHGQPSPPPSPYKP